jgi:hypothetical protein
MLIVEIFQAIGLITFIIILTIIFMIMIKIICKKKISPEYKYEIEVKNQDIINDIIYNKNSYSMDQINGKLNEILDKINNKELKKLERRKIINYIKTKLINMEIVKMNNDRQTILNYTNDINNYFRYLEEFDEIDNIIYNN